MCFICVAVQMVCGLLRVLKELVTLCSNCALPLCADYVLPAQCAGGFGCPRCDVLLDLAGSAWQPTTLFDGYIDTCTLVRGGGSCATDFHCGIGGVCVTGKCICMDDWTCPYCTQKVKQDTLAGEWVPAIAPCVNTQRPSSGIYSVYFILLCRCNLLRFRRWRRPVHLRR